MFVLAATTVDLKIQFSIVFYCLFLDIYCKFYISSISRTDFTITQHEQCIEAFDAKSWWTSSSSRLRARPEVGIAKHFFSFFKMVSRHFSPPFGEHVFFSNHLKQIYGSRSFFQKVMGLRRDLFTIDVHTDPSEIHESCHHQSQDTVFKAMQRRRFTYCTKSLPSKKCIAHGPTAESLIFGGPVSKKH